VLKDALAKTAVKIKKYDELVDELKESQLIAASRQRQIDS
jgi:hypothetical protein